MTTLKPTPKPTPKTNPGFIDNALEEFLSAEFDTLEGEQDAVKLWNALKEDAGARLRYDALVLAMRHIGGRKGLKSFGEDEADALWPLVMGQVAEDARNRSGLSKEALRHLAVPSLVASISKALVSYTQKTTDVPFAETVIEASVAPETTAQQVNFSLTSVGGEVSLRLYKNDETGFVAQVNNAEVKTNVAQDEVGAWSEVSSALSMLSMMTSELLGQEALVNGRIDIKDGKAEIRFQPLATSKHG